jgi:FkbM family methyltransferase
MRSVTLIRKTVSNFTRYYKVNIKKDLFLTNIYKWQDIRGDDTLRLDYPLNESSLVFDVGGYLGDFSAKVHCRYNCNSIIFEPVKEYYKKIMERFKYNNKIKVYNFGLADRTFDAEITVDSVSSSLFNKSLKKNQREVAHFVSINDFIKEYNINHIDLMKINIEGSEYDLLDTIVDNQTINHIAYLQIQYHLFIPNAQERRFKIQHKLQNTHIIMWDYPFVWESWRIK